MLVFITENGQNSNENQWSVSELAEKDIAAVSTFVIHHDEPETRQLLLKALRHNSNPNVYLKPIVAVASNSVTTLINEGFDWAFNDSNSLNNPTSEWQQRCHGINRWIGTLPNNDGKLQDSSIHFRALRLLSSRNERIKPLKTITDKYGFYYPILTPLFEKSDGSVSRVLEFLESQQLLTPFFEEKAHSCSSCDSAFLSFKETCPDCHSDNLEKTELIHHFKCGHVASVEDFTQNNKLTCPKCNLELKHIGVDYDKPSAVHRCRQCNLSFQEAKVQAQCYACGSMSTPDDLTLRDINAYEVSAIGNNAARYGLDALFTQILQTDLVLYTNQELKNFIRVEKARIARYKKSTSVISYIYFSNLEQLFGQLGQRTEQLFKELSAVFRSVFRESDLITARNESAFAVLMTETDEKNAIKAMERLEESSKNLFKQSLSFELELHSKIIDIENSNQFEQDFDAFLKDIN